MSTPYSDVDRFGVLGRMLSLSDEFYGVLGRVTALGALLELRMDDLVTCWTKSGEHRGRPFSVQQRQVKKLQKRRDVPDHLARAVAAANIAMDERHKLVHSLWPGENIGWRNRPGGSVQTDVAGIDDVQPVIERLVAAVDGLQPFMYSPID